MPPPTPAPNKYSKICGARQPAVASSAEGQKANYSLRANDVRSSPGNGHTAPPRDGPWSHGKVVSTDVVKRTDRTQDASKHVSFHKCTMSMMRMALVGMAESSGLVWKIAAIRLNNRLPNASPGIWSVQKYPCDMTRRTPQTRYLNLGRSAVAAACLPAPFRCLSVLEV
jgi:hypothetical protein